jgi:hypothetical protein
MNFQSQENVKNFPLFCLVNFIYLEVKDIFMSLLRLHFMIGMFVGLVLCLIVYIKYKKILLYNPLIMTAFGVWASFPDIINFVFGFTFKSNIFLFYNIIESFNLSSGFFYTLLLYNLGFAGQIFYIKYHLRK